MGGAQRDDGMTDGDRPGGDRPRGDEPSYIVIEGCIGVGKTTLTHLMAERFGARVVLEQFEENPFLPEFYADQKAHAFKTQMFFLLSRFKQQEELHQQELFKQRIVSDYLFAKDRIFAELTLNDSELALYEQVFQALQSKVPKPDLVVYLHAPIHVILQRIQQRGRAYEQNMDPGYLEQLSEAYERFFARFEGCPSLIVDTQELNFPARPEDFEVLVDAALEASRAGAARRLLTGNARQPSLV